MPRSLYSRIVLPTSAPIALGELGMDGSSRLSYYNGSRVVPLNDDIEANTFGYPGAIAVKIGQSRWYIEAACTWSSGRLAVAGAPTGATLICDINKNGTTIYTTQGNRPTIAISGHTQLSTAPDITTFAIGDYVTVDVDQIGSTVVGADLTYTLRLRRT